MGLQIAMYVGDMGMQVDLFDLPGNAQKALASAVKNGLGTMSGRACVTPRNFIEAEYPLLNKADWIVEAVFEDEKVKDEVNATIARYAKAEAFITTNTSGIGLNSMSAKQPVNFRKNYALSHFFNPVKVLPLLEVCPCNDMDSEKFAAFCHFAEYVLGKSIVQVEDTPNFVGNRIGGLCLFLPFRLETEGLSLLDIDRICLNLVGWEPLKTWDIVGLQLAGPVGGNVYHRAPDDPLHDWWNPDIREIKALLAKGYSGRKGKTQSGFFALKGKQKLMFNFTQSDYVPAELSNHKSLVAAMAAKKPIDKLSRLLSPETNDPAALFAQKFFFATVAYSLHMVGKICKETSDIDRALEHGFNWPGGIFKLTQQFGLSKTLEGIHKAGFGHLVPAWFSDLAKKSGNLYGQTDNTFYSVSTARMAAGATVTGGIYPDKIKKTESKIIFANSDAAVLDITGDKGPVCLVVFTSRGNSIGMLTLDAINKAIVWAERHEGAVIIGNTSANFSAGANLFQMLEWSEKGNVQAIRELVVSGQKTIQRLCYCHAPTVAVPCGYTMGGGSEIALGCSRRVVNSQVVWGQTELNVGVIPGWTGLMRTMKIMMTGLQPYYLWSKDFTVSAAVDHLMPVWYNYAWIQTSRDAYHAREMGFLSPGDIIVPAQGLGQPYVLKRAREVAEAMLLAGYTPPAPFVFNLPGAEGFAKFKLQCEQGAMMDQFPVDHPQHNSLCAQKAAWVLCGGNTRLGQPVTEDQLLELEVEGFLEVVMRPEARSYIKKILKM
jgi:3-hydroxyacyl-CoA dehydrogenase